MNSIATYMAFGLTIYAMLYITRVGVALRSAEGEDFRPYEVCTNTS